RSTSTPHAGTGFRYAMNPHFTQATRRTPCSWIFRIAPPQTMQKRASGRVARTTPARGRPFFVSFMVFVQAPGTHTASVHGKIGREWAFLKRNVDSGLLHR